MKLDSFDMDLLQQRRNSRIVSNGLLLADVILPRPPSVWNIQLKSDLTNSYMYRQGDLALVSFVQCLWDRWGAPPPLGRSTNWPCIDNNHDKMSTTYESRMLFHHQLFIHNNIIISIAHPSVIKSNPGGTDIQVIKQVKKLSMTHGDSSRWRRQAIKKGGKGACHRGKTQRGTAQGKSHCGYPVLLVMLHCHYWLV